MIILGQNNKKYVQNLILVVFFIKIDKNK